LNAVAWNSASSHPLLDVRPEPDIKKKRMIMKALMFAVAFVFVGAPIAVAQAGPADQPDSQSLSAGAKESTPAVTGGGSTTAPTAEPKSGSLSDSAKETTDSGTNASTNPTGKPASSDLGSKKTNN
jgi:hypothetical protein